MLIPTPKYKIKITTGDEQDALMLICNDCDQVNYLARLFLAYDILLKIAAMVLACKTKYTIKLNAVEATTFKMMCIDVNTVYGDGLSPYNKSYNQGHITAITQMQTQYMLAHQAKCSEISAKLNNKKINA